MSPERRIATAVREVARSLTEVVRALTPLFTAIGIRTAPGRLMAAAEIFIGVLSLLKYISVV